MKGNFSGDKLSGRGKYCFKYDMLKTGLEGNYVKQIDLTVGVKDSKSVKLQAGFAHGGSGLAIFIYAQY